MTGKQVNQIKEYTKKQKQVYWIKFSLVYCSLTSHPKQRERVDDVKCPIVCNMKVDFKESFYNLFKCF